MDKFAINPEGERRVAFNEAAARRDISNIIMEKDFWVCWTLKRLFTNAELALHMTFKGGTSLSKAYGIIERFSEDIDLTISRDAPFVLGVKNPMEQGISGNELGRRIDDLKRNAQRFVAEVVLPKLRADIRDALGTDKGWEIVLDAEDVDQQTVLFHYPPTMRYERESYIQPIIKLEFGARGEKEPQNVRNITPYVAQTLPKLFGDANFEVPTLAVERSFWEKATILHMLYHAAQHGAKLRPKMSRHYYDTYMLTEKGVSQTALGNPALLDQVVRNKSLLFRDNKASYETAKIGSLKLVPGAELAVALKAEYAKMEEMFMGDAPDFDTVLAGLEKLESTINKETTK